MAKAEFVRLVEEAGLIFRGKVVRQGTTDARLMAAAEGKTATVEVEEVLLSTEALRGLAGREVILVSEHEGAKEEGSQVFFTSVVALGDHVVARELGRSKWSRQTSGEIAEAVKAAQERPLQARVAGAELVITGRVAASRRAEEPSIFRSEHDPEWWIARVEVLSVEKGGKVEGEIEVLFPNSTDIAWYKSPKLHEGAHGILLLHRAEGKEHPREKEKGRGREKEKEKDEERRRPIYEVSDPLDFLPMERLEDVRRLLGYERGER